MFTKETATTHVSVEVSPPTSVTVSSKVRVSPEGPTSGDVKVGVAEEESESVTVGPDNCDQVKDTIDPSGSYDLVPSRVTSSPSFTV
jgi:hypothetical protein